MDNSHTTHEWWYVTNEGHQGPVGEPELQRLLASGELGAGSLVWQQGMEGWRKIGQVQLLAGLLATVPPELPPTPDNTNDGNSSDFTCGATAAASWRVLFFSFRGRINRQPFWFATILLFTLKAAAASLLGLTLGLSATDLGKAVLTLGVMFVLLAAAISEFAVAAKRLHDLDWSGWWALLFLVPVLMGLLMVPSEDEGLASLISLAQLLSLAVFLLLGIVKGTSGMNRYGPNPLAGMEVSEPHQLLGKTTSAESPGSGVGSWVVAKVEAIGGVAFIGVYVFGFAGWAYWMWLAIQFGSFLMFFIGLLGPLGLIAALLGMWSLIFGVPDWLTSLVT